MVPALRIAVLAASLATAMAAVAADAPAASAPAADVEPPRCDDARVLADVRRAYEAAASSGSFAPLVRIRPREVALVDHVAALDTARNRILLHGDPWGRSRFCQARLELARRGSDTAYWRIDARKDAPQDAYALTPCFAAWARKVLQDDDIGEPRVCDVARP